MPSDWLPYVPVAALCISVVALFVSGANLGWNVYRELALRARVKVWFGVRQIVGPGVAAETKLVLSVTNLGPGVVRPQMIHYRSGPAWRRFTRGTGQGVVLHDWTEPRSGKLPCTLEVGETTTLMLPYNADALQDDMTHIGISDSFGRTHWVTRRDVKEALVQFRKDFPKK
jgi:hypothetical protein